MAKEIYPFAYIIQGDFAGMYVYFAGMYHVRSESVHKDGLFSEKVWEDAKYSYSLQDIAGYEELGSATHSADATSVLKAGFWLGAVGAIAATAIGSGTTHDTAIYFKDGKKSVFRFLSSQAHQDYITAFYQHNIKHGNPNVTTRTNIVDTNIPKIESGQPTPLGYVGDLVGLSNQIIEHARYDLYALILNYGIPEIADTISYLSKYTDSVERVKQQIDEQVEYVLVRVDAIGTEIMEILDAQDITLGAMFGAQIRPEIQVPDNEQSEVKALNYEELKQLKELFDLGVISQEEFDTKKKQLLGF